MTTNTGSVIDIWMASEPESGEPAYGIQTDATDVDMSPWNRPCNCVWVRPGQRMPAIGQVIDWGPHHVWFMYAKITKLGNSFNRDDPLH